MLSWALRKHSTNFAVFFPLFSTVEDYFQHFTTPYWYRYFENKASAHTFLFAIAILLVATYTLEFVHCDTQWNVCCVCVWSEAIVEPYGEYVSILVFGRSNNDKSQWTQHNMSQSLPLKNHLRYISVLKEFNKVFFKCFLWYFGQKWMSSKCVREKKNRTRYNSMRM